MLLPISEAVPLLPGSVARVENVHQNAETPVPQRFPHFHGPAELVLIKAGNGEFISEDKPVRFSTGSLIFVPPMVVHDFAFEEGVRAWTLVQFDPYAVDADAARIPSVPLNTVLSPELNKRIEMLMEWLDESIAAKGDQRTIALQLQTLVLAVRQTIALPDRKSQDAGSSLSRYRPLLDLWNHDQGKTICLTEAASLCGVSTPYFSRRFKSVFGTGFSAYQTRLKVLQAARMLATSDKSVSQIGYALGFKSPAYFTFCFRSAFGVTPTIYRANQSTSHDG
ncbi:helix-turn-helix domain-containing protein [Sphingorhabdus lacus]|uniref:helix-turn-helix domain-containing protein n=1 Tax=Sphingorhabdus lacus TaxID=392610 RepID=UPI0035937EBD